MSRVLAALWPCAPRASAQLSDLPPGRNFPTAAPVSGAGRSESIDAADVDNDGDLDVVVANGADGGVQANRSDINLGGTQGGIHGAFLDESAARFAGMPADTSREAEFADMDGDGDPDTHAPTLLQFTQAVDKTDGSDTPVIAQLRDNSGWFEVDAYPVDLIYSVEIGLEQCLPMASQGGQQFGARSPGGIPDRIP